MTDPWSKAQCDKCGYPHIGAPCMPDCAAVNAHVRQWNEFTDGLDKKRWKFLEWMSTHGRDDLKATVAAHTLAMPIDGPETPEPEPEMTLIADRWGAA